MADPPTPIARADKRDRGWFFFYVPLVFHARSVISPVNFTKLAPTAISLCPPGATPLFLFCSRLSPPSKTPHTIRFFFIACASNLFGRSFFRELAIKVVTPGNRVHRTRFVRSIARVTRLLDNVRQRKMTTSKRNRSLFFFPPWPLASRSFCAERVPTTAFFINANDFPERSPFYYDWERAISLNVIVAHFSFIKHGKNLLVFVLFAHYRYLRKYYSVPQTKHSFFIKIL